MGKLGANIRVAVILNGSATTVARFNANSDRTNLNCNRNPTNSYARLGVFECAEGADAKIGRNCKGKFNIC
ncbi:hypothetical protein J4461_02060 [Candidatus Pacearchaeota archaeon]|nr:hypothetical protein [Candidatus Pacearchaeota archaeon]